IIDVNPGIDPHSQRLTQCRCGLRAPHRKRNDLHIVVTLRRLQRHLNRTLTNLIENIVAGLPVRQTRLQRQFPIHKCIWHILDQNDDPHGLLLDVSNAGSARAARDSHVQSTKYRIYSSTQRSCDCKYRISSRRCVFAPSPVETGELRAASASAAAIYGTFDSESQQKWAEVCGRLLAEV